MALGSSFVLTMFGLVDPYPNFLLININQVKTPSFVLSKVMSTELYDFGSTNL